MSLTDIVSSLNQSVLTQVALVLFLAAFAGLLVRLFQPGHKRAHAHAANLPLEDSMVSRPHPHPAPARDARLNAPTT